MSLGQEVASYGLVAEAWFAFERGVVCNTMQYNNISEKKTERGPSVFLLERPSARPRA